MWIQLNDTWFAGVGVRKACFLDSLTESKSESPSVGNLKCGIKMMIQKAVNSFVCSWWLYIFGFSNSTLPPTHPLYRLARHFLELYGVSKVSEFDGCWCFAWDLELTLKFRELRPRNVDWGCLAQPFSTGMLQYIGVPWNVCRCAMGDWSTADENGFGGLWGSLFRGQLSEVTNFLSPSSGSRVRQCPRSGTGGQFTTTKSCLRNKAAEPRRISRKWHHKKQIP